MIPKLASRYQARKEEMQGNMKKGADQRINLYYRRQ